MGRTRGITSSIERKTKRENAGQTEKGAQKRNNSEEGM